jgi:hypothetical protein
MDTMGAGSRARTIMRALVGVLGGVASLVWLFLAFVVLDSRFSTDPAGDPHGYGLMFGSVMALVVGLAVTVVLPFAFVPSRRARATRIAMATYAVVSALLLAAWFTA